jgi:thymidylate synthase
MIAQVCDLEAGEFIHTFGTHIYNNHMEQLQLQLSKNQSPPMILNPSIKTYSNLNLMILRWKDMIPIPY